MEKEESLYLKNQLCFPLYVASRLTTKLYAPLLKKLDITYPQYLVLLVLWQEDGKTVNEICRLLYLETNTLTPLLKRLEQKELIIRKRSESDERSVIVTLTEAGRNLKSEATCIPSKIVEAFQDSDMKFNQVKDFKSTLLEIVKILGEKTSA